VIEPERVATNVTRAASGTGIAGISIEDSTGDEGGQPLFDRALSVERVRAAREAIDATGTGVLLTARSEGFIAGRPDLEETIRRLAAYAEAGADCLFAPGLRAMSDIAAIVAAVAPKPVNVLVGSDFTTVAELAQVGVRRISVGGALARTAWGAATPGRRAQRSGCGTGAHRCQESSTSSAALFVRRTRPVPSTFITYTSSSPSRSLVNAIRCPSGDQVGN
jgi:2-methylisocitrate lyase-like PEP mutase family enzyme